MRIGSRTINGVDTEVHADVHGRFYIQIDGKSIGSGDTLDAAVVEARNSINRDKTKVEVAFISRAGEHGIATGFHSRNRTTMARLSGGKSEQLEYQYKCFKADTPKTTVDRYNEIEQQIRTLTAERNGIDKEWGVMLRDLVQQGITDAQSKTLAGVTAKAAERRTGVVRKRRY
jgi:hypothetical protein